MLFPILTRLHFPLLKCVLYHLLKENLWYFVIFRQKSGGCVLHSFHHSVLHNCRFSLNLWCTEKSAHCIVIRYHLIWLRVHTHVRMYPSLYVDKVEADDKNGCILHVISCRQTVTRCQHEFVTGLHQFISVHIYCKTMLLSIILRNVAFQSICFPLLK